MRDHLGGGFHRYSVDEFWHVPHFEKMLYDQAQLAVSFTEAWQLTHEEFFADIARETLDYVLRDMTHPEGGFFSAEDADSLLSHGRPEHAEGAFYVWSRQEIVDALGADEARIFCRHYGVEEVGNAPAGSDPHGEFRGKNILLERQDVTTTARDTRNCRRNRFEISCNRPRQALRPAREAPATASRRQDSYGLERTHDFGVFQKWRRAPRAPLPRGRSESREFSAEESDDAGTGSCEAGEARPAASPALRKITRS